MPGKTTKYLKREFERSEWEITFLECALKIKSTSSLRQSTSSLK